MPLSGGTSGAHDDAMHQGSAKRGVVNGVGGLDASGHLIAVGAQVKLKRNPSEYIYIGEVTSAETPLRIIRNGANDYRASLMSGGVGSIIQLANMKDVVNGMAGLDAAGALLVPGSKMYYTRDGSDDVHIYERTSNEEAYAFHRVGADDYTFFVKESNVWKRMQTESMKDAANGIAGLDANILLSPALLPPCLEEYSNHLGVVDNFTQTVTGGNGTANTDAANHEMDLSSGVTVTGYAKFGIKDSYTLASKPIVFNALIQNIALGAGGQRWEKIGLCVTWNHPGQNNEVGFMYQSSVGNWYTKTRNGANEETNNITALANGDLCTIRVSDSKALFFVNGTLVATHTLYIPTVGMTAGVVAGTEVSAATSSIDISVDMISLKRNI